jgi:apolipoprotein N-acyltransferase
LSNDRRESAFARSKPRIFSPLQLTTTVHLEDAAPVYSREDILAARFRVARVLPYQRASSPFISNLALALFSGLLLVFAFPDWSLWSLGWVGAAPLTMALVREQRFWRGLPLGWVTGTVFFAGSSHWVTYSMNHYGGIPLWLSYLVMMILAAAMGSFTGLFAGAYGFAIKRLGGWAILTAPLLWPASEYLRLKVTGVGWNALGYSQAFQPSVIQVSRWGGVYLVSAVMIAATTALVYAMVYLEQRRGLIVLTVGGVLAVASVLYGESLRPEGEPPHSLLAVVVQPDIPIVESEDSPDSTFREQMLRRHISLSEEAIQETNAGRNGERRPIGLVIWPESSMNFEYDRDPDLKRRLAEFTTRNHVFLLFNSWGFASRVEDFASSGPIYNSAIMIGPDGNKIGEYDKVALVPFGEYVPARGWIPFMDRIPALAGDVTAGRGLTTLEAGSARLGPSICFETTRPDLAAGLRRDGATTMVQISNEAWFGPTACAHQMLTQAIFRAVENNIEFIRATNSGRSAKIDGFGHISGETPMFQTATRTWPLQTIDDVAQAHTTFYTRHGDVFAVGSVIMSAVLICASILAPLLVKDPFRTRTRPRG